MGLKKAFPIYSCDLSLTALEKYVSGSVMLAVSIYRSRFQGLGLLLSICITWCQFLEFGQNRVEEKRENKG